jgi:hypothetical protein
VLNRASADWLRDFGLAGVSILDCGLPTVEGSSWQGLANAEAPAHDAQNVGRVFPGNQGNLDPVDRPSARAFFRSQELKEIAFFPVSGNGSLTI